MIKPEQIPYEVIVAACEEYGGGHLVDMKHAIAAALNAWPWKFTADSIKMEHIVLPLKEANDD